MDVTRFLSFDKLMGEGLIKLLYVVASIWVLFNGLRAMWKWLLYLDNDIGDALWGLIMTPLKAIVTIIAIRVASELAIAAFRFWTRGTVDAEGEGT